MAPKSKNWATILPIGIIIYIVQAPRSGSSITLLLIRNERMFCNERTDVLLLIRNTFSGEYCSDDGVPKFQKLIQNHFEHYLSDLVNYNIKTSWSPIKMLARVHHGSPDSISSKISSQFLTSKISKMLRWIVECSVAFVFLCRLDAL